VPDPPPWRAIAVGLVFCLPGFYFGTYGYQIVQAIMWGQTSLQMAGVMTLFVAVIVLYALGRVARPLRLDRRELLVVYAMATLTTAIGGSGMLAFLVPTLPAGHYYATPINKWEEFSDFIPPWLTVNDPAAVRGFFEATGTLYSRATLDAWAAPLAFWLPFTALLVLGTLALCNLLAQQWITHEHLVFPLVQVPLALTAPAEQRRFWTNRLTWLGFGIAGVLESVNFINYLYPAFPRAWLKARPVGQSLTGLPLAAVKPLHVSFFPFMIGVAFLLSTETSFSCWFFYWLGKLECVLCAALGFGGRGSGRGITQLPLLDQQGTGALLTLMVLVLVVAWANLRRTLGSSRPRGAQILSSRASLAIAGLCFLGLVGMSNAAGMPVLVAALYFVLRWLFALAWGRVVAETGCGWTRQYQATIQHVISEGVGTAGMPRRGLAVLAMFRWFNNYGDSRAPHILAALKLADETGIPKAQLRNALLVTIGVAILWCTWTHLHIFYTYGAAMAKCRGWYTAEGRGVWAILERYLTAPAGPNWWEIGGYLSGGCAALGLSLGRRVIPNWPFHPFGYAVANTGSMHYMWMPFLLSWAIKSAVLKYAGFAIYERLVPFFLGLIVGDFVVPGLWGFGGMLTGKRMYMFFPH